MVAAARSVLQVERDPKNTDVRIVRQIKNSLAPSDGEIKFSITAEQGFQWLECEIVQDPAAEPEAPVFESKSEKAAYLIKKLLSEDDTIAVPVLPMLASPWSPPCCVSVFFRLLSKIHFFHGAIFALWRDQVKTWFH